MLHYSWIVTGACNSSYILRVACFFFCSPVPEITWRRANGIPFPSKVKMKYSNAVLEIPSFQQDDTGGYECVAENKMGRNTVAGRLAFYGMVTFGCVVHKTFFFTFKSIKKYKV